MPPKRSARACVRGRTAALLTPLLALALASFAAAALAAAALAAGAVAGSNETPGNTFAASLTPAGAFADAGTSPPLSISDDGRYLAFVSAAANLSDEAPAGKAEVYVKDLETGAVELASRASGELGAVAESEPFGEHAAKEIEAAAISGDGRYVVFASQADNLVAGLPLAEEVAEEALVNHVYRRDLQTDETTLVDRVSGATGGPVGREARAAAISSDGRYVLFGSAVEDLEDPAGEHEEGDPTLYLRDMQTATTTAVGRAGDDGGEPGELAAEGSFNGDVTPDGHYVVFASPGENLDPEANGLFQVYRRDLRSGETVLVSRTNPTGSAPAGEASDGDAFEPFFVGADGCRVAFVTAAAANLFGAGAPPVSATYLRNLCASPPSTALISLDDSGQPFEEGVFAGASGDGREILLKASSLTEPASHLYLRDLGSGWTTLVDRAAGSAGAAGEVAVEQGAISRNGCRVAFTSGATNLTSEVPPAGGSSQQLQAYVRQLAGCDPAPDEPGKGDGQSQGRRKGAPTNPPPPFSVGVGLISRHRLWLDFDAAAKASVRIQESIPRRHSWRLVRSFQVEAHGPETVKRTFPYLARGFYRLTVRPQVPGAESIRQVFPVGIDVAARP